MNAHLCSHSEHDVHECICAMEHNHTTAEFRKWHADRHIPILESQKA